jgi:anti-sigma factor ChrR (cupin superfamily)
LAEPFALRGLLDRDRFDDFAWRPFRPGVEVVWLHRGDADTGAGASALLRYAPGATVPAHVHPDVEHVLVLAGAQRDDHGVYRRGDVAVNPPDSRHAVASEEGCVVLVIWARPVRFVDEPAGPLA